MRSGTFLVVIGGLAMGVLACEESTTAPGVCPDFCPTGEIQLVDTVLVGVVEADTSFTGYVEPDGAIWMQVVGGDPGMGARSVMWYPRFRDTVQVDSISTGPVVELDSFRLDLVLVDRTSVPGLAVTVHRLPPTVDRESDFSSLDPFFEDSTVVGTVVIPDGVFDDTVSAIIPADAFPTFQEDSQQVALGLSIRGSTPAFATFETRDANLGALLQRFVKIEASPGDTVERLDFVAPEFDTFVDTDLTAPVAGSLIVGGTPSSRTFVRVLLPPSIMDSSDIVRAHLLMIPIEPAMGAPGDTLQLVAEPMGADFGPKSPIIASHDSVLVKTSVGVGTLDTIPVDISAIMAFWQGDPEQVRILVVRTRFEAASMAEVRMGSTRTLGFQPLIRVTYVPPFSFVQ
jgi:hypothetical protein